jgi:hypothetical protein
VASTVVASKIQVSPSSRLIICICAQERDDNKKAIQNLQEQLQKAESSQKMQMDRANERLKNYERALFDTRQVLAMKDAKIATLESNINRLTSGQPLNSARSASSDNPMSGYGSTPPPQAAYSSVQALREAAPPPPGNLCT